MASISQERSVALFDHFTASQREHLTAIMKPRRVRRGEVLYAADEDAEALFVVCHGRFELGWGHGQAPTLIGAGEVIGEMAFFGRLAHNHTAVALRDSQVLVLTRSDYDRVVGQDKDLAAGFLRLATRRLHQLTSTHPRPERRQAHNAAIALVPAPSRDIPAEFFSRLRRILERRDVIVVDRSTIASRFGNSQGDEENVVAWLNALERSGKKVVLLTDGSPSPWTERCIRQADQVVLVGKGIAPNADLSEIERSIVALHPPQARRLVLIHPRRQGVVSGTRHWLDRIEVALHHHVSLEDDVDLESLSRFLTDAAVGFVAGGGGGLGSAHVGIYKAFREAGVTFDIFMGTSVGAAMVAGFSFLYEAEGLTAGTHDIFVASRSFKRPTWPRYGLLDHTAFDNALKRAYGANTLIEDCWRPFRAVATNLTTRSLELIGTGPLWQAVRASSSIPCVLPPFISESGSIYIDGGVMDDAPLGPMKTLKTGPNVVVHFGKKGDQRPMSNYNYHAIPGRARLIASLLNPFARLPRGPRPLDMLFRTMLAHQRYELPADELDLVLTPPSPRGASIMNFDNHHAVSQAAYQWQKKRLPQRPADWTPALAAILPSAPPEEDEVATPKLARAGAALLDSIDA